MTATPDLVHFLSQHPGPFVFAVRGNSVDLEFEDGSVMSGVELEVLRRVFDDAEQLEQINSGSAPA